MPDSEGKLTPSEKSLLATWLNTRAAGPGANSACPVCGTNNWVLGDHLLNAMVFHPGGAMVIGGPTYPMAFIACSNCQHVRTFMALPIGIAGSATPPPKPKGSDG